MKTKPNIPLLKRLRTRFLRMRHAEHFDMRPIAMKTDCGAAMCIAGHVLDLTGHKMRLRADFSESGGYVDGRLDFDFIAPTGRKIKNPLVAAARELHLKAEWGEGGAYDLFHNYNLKTPKQAAARIQELIDCAESAR